MAPYLVGVAHHYFYPKGSSTNEHPSTPKAFRAPATGSTDIHPEKLALSV